MPKDKPSLIDLAKRHHKPRNRVWIESLPEDAQRLIIEAIDENNQTKQVDWSQLHKAIIEKYPEVTIKADAVRHLAQERRLCR